MKKLLLILCLILSLISPTVLATGDSGDSGTLFSDGYVDEGGVVTISNSEGLFFFADLVNNGEDFSEKTVTLANDIDLQNISWTPIGTSSYKYSGTFDGAGHKISNISVDLTVQGVGLFGVVSNVTIKNLVVSGEIKTTAKYAGGIVGQSSGSCTVIIENCGNEANVTAGGANAAGIIGCNDGSAADITIKNCYNVGTIKGSKESAAISGWIGNSSGSNASEVINCYNIGIIEGVDAGNSFVRYSGSDSPLTNCYQLDTVVRQSNVDSISEESALSGELSVKLGVPFGQTIGTSDYPVINDLEVLVGYGDTCAPIYVNDLGDLSMDRPAHSDSFDDFYIGICDICGESNPESAAVNGIDFTNVSEDIAGKNWNWHNETKILELKGATFASSGDFVLKFPNESTIQFVEGFENLIDAKELTTKGIVSGSLTIEGNGKLVVNTMGSEAIYGSNEGSTVDIIVKDTTIETSNSIVLPNTNKNSSLTITNSKITTNRGLLNVSSGSNSEYTKLTIIDSELVVGKINVGNTANSGVTTIEAKNSSVDAQQTNGNVYDAATAFSGKDIVVKIEDSYWRAYTQGYGWGWYHSYAFRIDAGNSSNDDGSIDMSIQDSYLLLYGMNRGLNINSNGSISEDSSINNSVIISFAKGEDSNLNISYVNEEGASASAVDEIVENAVVFVYSNMQTNSAEPETTTTVYGSPVITESFVLPDSLGAYADLSAVTQGIVLTEGQSLTVAEGAVFDVDDVTILLNEGVSISGNIIGNIVMPEEVKMVIYYKDDTYLYNASLVESIESVGYTVPEPVVEETSCNTLVGWFTDEECTAQFDFSTVVSESLTLYSKWEKTHTWGEGVVTLEPTYTSTGIKTYTCAECDEGQKTEIIPKKVRSSGGSSSPTYTVTVEKSDDGSVKVSSARVRANATVTITVTPDNGKVIDEISVTDSKGNEIELIEKEENIYTYKQPKLSVTVKVMFKCSGEVGCPSYEYVDIDTDKWYHEALDFVIENCLMYGNELFYPDADLTRAELTEVLWLLENKPNKISEKRFVDVEEDNKYYNSIYWARENNIVNGYSEEYFGPRDSITREQMTAVLYRYSGYKKYGNVIDVDFNLEFNDVTDISTWAIDSIIWAVSNEVIMGYDSNELKPLGNITRAEMAQMIKNYLEVYVKKN